MTLNYKQIGTEGKPALIILHGLFGSLDNWMSLGREYARDFTVYLVDHPNHGKSPHSYTFTYEEVAADLLEFMQVHNIDKAHFIGHSMGGKSVMRFAQLYPEKCALLLIADIAPKAYPPHHQIILKALHSVDFSQVKSRTDAQDMMAEHITDQGVLFFLLKNLDRLKDGSYAWKMNLPVLEANMETIVGSIPKDTVQHKALFLRGEKSGYITEQDTLDIKTQFPNSKMVTIKNSGHWLHAEQADAFYQTTLQYLKNA